MASPQSGWYDQNGVYHPYDQAIISDPTLFRLYTVYQKLLELEAKIRTVEAKIDEIKRELERIRSK